MSASTVSVPSISAADLIGAGVSSHRTLLGHPSVRASLLAHGIAVVRGYGNAVHPRVSAVAASMEGSGMLSFLDALDPSIARRTVRMNRFSYHVASTTRASHPCLVQDRGCASTTEPQTFRSAFTKPSEAFSEDFEWDELLTSRLPGRLLLYGSDVHNVSLLSYERDGAGAGAGGGASLTAATAVGGIDLSGLDMTRLSARDCLYRAMMMEKGLSWPGMSTCYTYFGRAAACFAAHAEDHNLPSINQLVYGAPKVWFAVPGANFGAANAAIRAAVPRGELPNCPQSLAHKLVLPSLAVLQGAGLPVARVVQRAGDLIITAPGAVHFGINTGDNVAESTNVADVAWLEGPVQSFMELGPCSCRHKNAWDLIPRVWLPRAFLLRRLAAPAPDMIIASASTRKRRAGDDAASVDETAARTPLKKRKGTGAGAGAGAGSSASANGAPLVTVADFFGVPVGVFAPPPQDSSASGEASAAAEEPAVAPASQWFVASVLEHRFVGPRGRIQFRVQWRGYEKNAKVCQTWHAIDVFRTENSDGMMPGELSCTLMDAKIGAYLSKVGLGDSASLDAACAASGAAVKEARRKRAETEKAACGTRVF